MLHKQADTDFIFHLFKANEMTWKAGEFFGVIFKSILCKYLVFNIFELDKSGFRDLPQVSRELLCNYVNDCALISYN